jgi:hypothetical protein
VLAAWELIRPGRAAAVLEERSRLIAELEGEVAAMKESLAAAEAAAEAERVGFDEKITKMKTLLQVCRSATFVPSTTYQCEYSEAVPPEVWFKSGCGCPATDLDCGAVNCSPPLARWSRASPPPLPDCFFSPEPRSHTVPDQCYKKRLRNEVIK